MRLPPYFADADNPCCEFCAKPISVDEIRGLGFYWTQSEAPPLVAAVVLAECAGCQTTTVHVCGMLPGPECARQLYECLTGRRPRPQVTPSIRPGTPSTPITEQEVRRLRRALAKPPSRPQRRKPKRRRGNSRRKNDADNDGDDGNP